MRGIEHIPWLYDGFMALCERGGFGRWRRWLVDGARGRTLDLGTGTGRNLPLYGDGTRVVAVELRRHMLRAARRRMPRVPMVLGDAEALPFGSGTFDTVVSGLVFCSVNDPVAGLREVRRVLAPGGSLRMLEHVRSRRRFGAWWQDRIQPAWTWFAGGCRPNRDTEANVRAAGFAIDPATYRARHDMRRFEARAP